MVAIAQYVCFIEARSAQSFNRFVSTSVPFSMALFGYWVFVFHVGCLYQDTLLVPSDVEVCDTSSLKTYVSCVCASGLCRSCGITLCHEERSQCTYRWYWPVLWLPCIICFLLASNKSVVHVWKLVGCCVQCWVYITCLLLLLVNRIPLADHHAGHRHSPRLH